MNKVLSVLKKPFSKENVSTVTSTILCIILGIVVGFFVLLFSNPAEAFSTGLVNILFGGFNNLSKVFSYATPVILTGVSVALANKCGLFNIGASGQFLAGSAAALYFALVLHQNWFICILMAALAGFIYGAIPGLCKAFFNVNEVITSIMLNWIGLFLTNVFVLNVPGMFMDKEYKTDIVTGDSLLPRFDQSDAYSNIGIIIAIIIALVVWVVISKTTFGFELKACGFNREASRYSGINTKKNVVLSMAISGAIAGVAGALLYLVGNTRYTPQRTTVPVEGFNGIPVALLANSNPIGCIVTGIYVSFLNVCGDYMQPTYVKEVINFVISCIIYLSAFSLLFKNLILKDEKVKSFFKNIFKRKEKVDKEVK